ncbi:hypothetical protein [Burkholderia gladioli]|uniref:hypothetical protein n=1 Tax=Burkholderia gladioli TaxID=28095 RepID=UPI0016406231|nr:hypothetical protein [Burkholderia gladioli]
MSALRIADRQHNRSEATASAEGTESAAKLTMFVGIVPESGAMRFDVSATEGFAMALAGGNETARTCHRRG